MDTNKVASPVITGPPLSPVVAIRKYFMPEATLQDAVVEIKALSSDEKRELAEGAARELGVTLVG